MCICWCVLGLCWIHPFASLSAFEKALLYFDGCELPINWNREELLGPDDDDGDEGDEVSTCEHSQGLTKACLFGGYQCWRGKSEWPTSHQHSKFFLEWCQNCSEYYWSHIYRNELFQQELKFQHSAHWLYIDSGFEIFWLDISSMFKFLLVCSLALSLSLSLFLSLLWSNRADGKPFTCVSLWTLSSVKLMTFLKVLFTCHLLVCLCGHCLLLN